jgi:hypothetical protein
MSFVIQEFSIVDISIGIVSDTSALHPAFVELSFISALIWPYHYSFAFELIVSELALVNFARINEVILAFAMELAIDEFTCVCASFEFKLTFSGLLAFDEVSIVHDFVIIPRFKPFPILHIIFPLPYVHATFSVTKYSVAVCFAI